MTMTLTEVAELSAAGGLSLAVALAVRWFVLVWCCIIQQAFGAIDVVTEPQPIEIGTALNRARVRRLVEWCEANEWELRMADARYQFYQRENNPLAVSRTAMPIYGAAAA